MTNTLNEDGELSKLYAKLEHEFDLLLDEVDVKKKKFDGRLGSPKTNIKGNIMRMVKHYTPELITTHTASKTAEAYDNAAHWLADRLTSKKDVQTICETRAKVLRGEIEPPKSRFQLSPRKEEDRSANP